MKKKLIVRFRHNGEDGVWEIGWIRYDPNTKVFTLSDGLSDYLKDNLNKGVYSIVYNKVFTMKDGVKFMQSLQKSLSAGEFVTTAPEEEN